MENRILKLDNARKTINYLKKNGPVNTLWAMAERVKEEREDTYRYIAPTKEELSGQREESKDWPYLFSIVTPAYETKEEHLREMIASVRAQSYERGGSLLSWTRERAARWSARCGRSFWRREI